MIDGTDQGLNRKQLATKQLVTASDIEIQWMAYSDSPDREFLQLPESL